MGALATRRGFLTVALAIVACSGKEKATPRPSGPAQKEIQLPGAPILLGVGDIAVCDRNGDEMTGRLADSLLIADSAAGIPTVVATFGDNAYPSGPQGVTNDFQRCFAPSWGSSRILNVIHPAPGNHDYDSGSGGPYFSYFGGRAGPAGSGYYSYDVGSWHVVSLNSELYFEHGSPKLAKAQEDWLRQDLENDHAPCTLAYFHRPLFSSGVYSGSRQVRPLWDILYKHNADLVLNGHEHHYETFAPQDPSGRADPARGIAEIIVGTGGGDLRDVRHETGGNSLTRIHGRFGILKLALGQGEYTRAFIDVEGTVWDPARGKCH